MDAKDHYRRAISLEKRGRISEASGSATSPSLWTLGNPDTTPREPSC
ncbi:hypothetical protein [Metallosphaera hakonensis]|nr:hypothetical protein [Metallosphaera hakonensis]